jgi:hypothetical protein
MTLIETLQIIRGYARKGAYYPMADHKALLDNIEERVNKTLDEVEESD